MTTRQRTVETLDDLIDLVDKCPTGGIYVRWTTDPERDLESATSFDELTGVPLPGLSANSLTMEPWWDHRSPRIWAARRLYDYEHLREQRGPDARPWIFTGTEVGRGPDNEPLIAECALLAEVSLDVMAEAVAIIDELPADWGRLQRT